MNFLDRSLHLRSGAGVIPVALAALLATAELASAQVSVTSAYDVKHEFKLMPGGIGVPEISTYAYGHAWVIEPGCADTDVNPAGQAPNWNAFGEDRLVGCNKSTNSGTGLARNVEIAEDLPENLRIEGVDESESDIIRFHLVELLPGESREFGVTLRATKAGTYRGQGFVTAHGDVQAESDPVQIVVKEPVLEVRQQSPRRIHLGRTFAHQFTLTNTVQIHRILRKFSQAVLIFRPGQPKVCSTANGYR